MTPPIDVYLRFSHDKQVKIIFLHRTYRLSTQSLYFSYTFPTYTHNIVNQFSIIKCIRERIRKREHEKGGTLWLVDIFDFLSKPLTFTLSLLLSFSFTFAFTVGCRFSVEGRDRQTLVVPWAFFLKKVAGHPPFVWLPYNILKPHHIFKFRAREKIQKLMVKWVYDPFLILHCNNVLCIYLTEVTHSSSLPV